MTDPPVGLRERKKEKTRLAIKKQAFRLFRKQGYESTTVEQIAAATEISPSTFFRYFPTKESVLIEDLYQIEIARAFDAQPSDIGEVQAMHNAVREVFSQLPEAEMTSVRERNMLLLSTPELRAAYMEHLYRLMQLISESVARRVGRDRDDLEVLTFAWTMQGVMTAASMHWTQHDSAGPSYVQSVEKAFRLFENGLPLKAKSRRS